MQGIASALTGSGARVEQELPLVSVRLELMGVSRHEDVYIQLPPLDRQRLLLAPRDNLQQTTSVRQPTREALDR